MKILTAGGQVLIVPGYEFPPPGLPKSSKPFVPDSVDSRSELGADWLVEIRWHLKDGHQYGYIFYRGTQADCNQVAASIGLGTHAFGSDLIAGEAYNYTYRPFTTDKIKDPP